MKLCDVEMHIHLETHAAIFASVDGDRSNAKWLPKSQIEFDDTPGETTVVVTMPESLAIDKGLV